MTLTTTKKFFATAAAAGLCAAALTVSHVNAREGEGRHGKGGPLKKIMKMLDLTEAQKTQIKDIFEANKPQREALREQVQSGDLTKEQAREQGKALMQATMEKVKALLTAEQVQKLEEMKARRGERGERQGRKAGRHGQPGQRILNALDLTEEQRQQIQPITDAARAEGEALREKVKAGTLTREEAREQGKALMQSTMDKIKPLLTAEQITKLEQLKAQFKAKRGERRENRDN